MTIRPLLRAFFSFLSSSASRNKKISTILISVTKPLPNTARISQCAVALVSVADAQMGINSVFGVNITKFIQLTFEIANDSTII
ncbi:hypothetical protein [Vibrio cidicii]|uniref:hypothetical protein n=1 Tax=Vibrio cidicii TaxID=1763883 RepID=UPI0011127DF5|nr:hypothetical protein [Vibrio cidicii]